MTFRFDVVYPYISISFAFVRPPELRRQFHLPDKKSDRITYSLQRDSNDATTRRIHFQDQKNRPEVHNAPITRTAMIAPLRWANRPNVPKIRAHHDTGTISRGEGIAPFAPGSSAPARRGQVIDNLDCMHLSPMLFL